MTASASDQTDTQNDDIDLGSMAFETAMTELENTVRKLERGEVPLEDAVRLYERGVKLKRHCEKKLAEAEGKIEKLIVNKNGEVTGSEPFAD